MSKKILYVALFCYLLCGCSTLNLSAFTDNNNQNPIVTMILSDGQEIVIELYPDIAPNTVNNFISLSQEGYYDGLTFHRIIKDYIIQSGDPLENGYGHPGYTIKGEFASNGFKNKLKHTRGVLSMARGSKYDSAGSQFFITVQDATMLDGAYAAFGKVTQGIEVVDEINRLSELPKEDRKKQVTIEKVLVDTKKITYPEPIVIPVKQP